MNLKTISLSLLLSSVLSVLSVAQTASGVKTFNASGLSFDYPDTWTISDDSNGDAQQLTLAQPKSDVQIRVFVHKGHISPEKFPDAKKAFIDPYIAATVKQFDAMGGKPQQSADTSEIAGVKAEGVKVAANLGEPGAAKIYWVLLGQRVVIMTIFGPDREIKQSLPAWDMVRNSLKIEEKSTPKPSPKP